MSFSHKFSYMLTHRIPKLMLRLMVVLFLLSACTATSSANLFTLDSTHAITTSADGAGSVFAIDMDGDGDVDVLSASFLDNTIAWYENLQQSPTSQPSSQPSTGPTGQPTSQPTSQPSSEPTGQPSCLPSSQPTSRPSSAPTEQPSPRPNEFVDFSRPELFIGLGIGVGLSIALFKCYQMCCSTNKVQIAPPSKGMTSVNP